MERRRSKSFGIDRSEGRDDPSGAGGALGVSSDAKDEPKRRAWAVGEERTNDHRRHTPMPSAERDKNRKGRMPAGRSMRADNDRDERQRGKPGVVKQRPGR